MTAGVRIRAATAADAAPLATLAERCFRAAFAADNSPADMDQHCRDSYSPALQAAEIAAAHMHTLIADAGAAFAGFVQLRRKDPPDCIADRKALEIQRFYVDSAWHGRGIAQLLMQAAVQLARLERIGTLWLGVWERNPRAIAFYQKEGFSPVGRQVFTVGSDPQTDLVLQRALTGADHGG